MSVIIAGIHTNIGKTICSAVICQALGYDYWKPVQAGDLENSDSVFIKRVVSNPLCKIHPEAYRLNTPASPHYAAEIDGTTIIKANINLPRSDNNIVIETAGGIMSPLAYNYLNIDLIEQLSLPVILVSNNYLGSINHTLLSVSALRQKNIFLKGLVFSGESNLSSENFIRQYTDLPILFSIPALSEINATSIDNFVKQGPIKI
ncbi:dethiobiotin synthase [Ferruginibacter lapsinanis]|uniref:dethiobiotin synthase n=1 Tax=Ferruginibacter lapsinanis TaxID=563172 RepID=UPI001E57E4E0|nr:dethiobiotin synthase [Ferruginibacter lapsinanis]UEG49248.1 dethiobiotin synthase [Ferruginibacter lapsinanis]